MTAIRRYKEGRYHVGARLALDRDQLGQLLRLLEAVPAAADGILGGRQSVTFAKLDAIGPIAVKHYARGGLIRHIVRRSYLNWPRTRAEKELLWLETARRAGVRAPQPIAFAAAGRMWGPCWLITAAIPGPRSLIQLPENADQEPIHRQAREAVAILLRHRIWHRDLHPGNMIVDAQQRVYIIDFDRARYLRNDRLLEWFYIRRWQRAVVKYGLSPALARIMPSRAERA